MKRRILLVDDEVAVLLTLKAVLEISGFDVDTAASAREGKSKLRNREYHMVITDMRMENDEAGREVIAAARAGALSSRRRAAHRLPAADEDWQDMGADKMLVKPMHTRVLLQQIEKLLAAPRGEAEDLEHASRRESWCKPNGSGEAAGSEDHSRKSAARKAAKRTADKRQQKGWQRTSRPPAKQRRPRRTRERPSLSAASGP